MYAYICVCTCVRASVRFLHVCVRASRPSMNRLSKPFQNWQSLIGMCVYACVRVCACVCVYACVTPKYAHAEYIFLVVGIEDLSIKRI